MNKDYFISGISLIILGFLFCLWMKYFSKPVVVLDIILGLRGLSVFLILSILGVLLLTIGVIKRDKNANE